LQKSCLVGVQQHTYCTEKGIVSQKGMLNRQLINCYRKQKSLSNPINNELSNVTLLIERGSFAEAIDNLKDIIEEDEVDQQLIISVIIHLTDMLASKRKTARIKTAVARIRDIIDNYLDFSRTEFPLSVLVQTYLLQAKLAFLEGNLKNARILLVQARILAVEKDMPQLAAEIAREHGKLMRDAKIDRKKQFNGLLELNWLEQVVFHAGKEQQNGIQLIPEEKPVMFIIQSKEGVVLFSRTLDSEFIISDKLIGGFLTAASTFSNEIFSRPLDFIKIAEYNLLTKAEKPLVMVYVTRGEPEPALNKLIRFTKVIRILSPTWEALNENFSSWKPLIADTAVVITLEKLIKEIFLAVKQH
ncbi:MAG: hypothetical protein ACFFD4_25885, partial [Candidatus Odinarchaeota archaeon]